MHACRCFFRHALDGLAIASVPTWMALQTLFDRSKKNFFFFIRCSFKEGRVAILI
jgi:hypothetical protein